MKRLIRTTFLLLTLSVIAHSIYTNWQALEDSITFEIGVFVSITALHALFLIITAKRMHIVIQHLGKSQVKFREWMKLFIEGRLLNKIAPQLGNIHRGLELKSKNKISYTEYASSYLLFTWFDTAFNLTMVLLALAVFDSGLQDSTLAIYICASLLIFLALLPKIARGIGNISFAQENTKILSRAITLSRRLADAIHSAFKEKIFTKVAFLGVIASIFMCARLFLGFEIFNIEIGIVDVILMYTIYKVSTLIVITPGNIGIQELSIGLLSELLGYGLSEGIAVTLVLRVYGYVLFLALWVTLLMINNQHPTAPDNQQC